MARGHAAHRVAAGACPVVPQVAFARADGSPVVAAARTGDPQSRRASRAPPRALVGRRTAVDHGHARARTPTSTFQSPRLPVLFACVASVGANVYQAGPGTWLRASINAQITARACESVLQAAELGAVLSVNEAMAPGARCPSPPSPARWGARGWRRSRRVSRSPSRDTFGRIFCDDLRCPTARPQSTSRASTIRPSSPWAARAVSLARPPR